MKIIGRQGGKYILTATDTEIAHACGYKAANEMPSWEFQRGGRPWEGTLSDSFMYMPSAAQNYLAELREHEEKTRSSAAFLRGMADMIDGALPTTVIPPVVKSTEAAPAEPESK